jgi:16S rRNA (uracil1498-N3)-methyltransferase
VQRQAENQQSVRYEVEINVLKDFKLFGTVLATTQSDVNDTLVTMIISMPNKREKAEMIVQKLTEIGVSEIIFRPSERSIIREWNDKKAIRLEKIMKEALEQSRGRRLPKITFCLNIENYLKDNHVIIFDKS